MLLPFRDAEAHIDQALASLASQTLEDIEVVMVDDSSSDASPSIAAARAAADSRFRTFDCRGRGLVDALNTGLSVCRADWVARMDADDVCLPERLEAQLAAALEDGPMTVVSCLVELFPAGEVSRGMELYVRWLNSLRDPAAIRGSLFVESPIPHPSCMYSRSLVTGAGGYRDLGVPEDYELWLRLWKLGARFRKVERVLLRWREGAERLSRTSPIYALQRFYRLKAMHLGLAPALAGGRAVLWGSGQSGRRLSRWLLREGLEIEAFVDVAPGRIGHTMRGRPILPPGRLEEMGGLPVLVCTRSYRARREITGWLESHGRKEWSGYICCG